MGFSQPIGHRLLERSAPSQMWVYDRRNLCFECSCCWLHDTFYPLKTWSPAPDGSSLARAVVSEKYIELSHTPFHKVLIITFRYLRLRLHISYTYHLPNAETYVYTSRWQMVTLVHKSSSMLRWDCLTLTRGCPASGVAWLCSTGPHGTASITLAVTSAFPRGPKSRAIVCKAPTAWDYFRAVPIQLALLVISEIKTTWSDQWECNRVMRYSGNVKPEFCECIKNYSQWSHDSSTMHNKSACRSKTALSLWTALQPYEMSLHFSIGCKREFTLPFVLTYRTVW